jgi:putative SOS response-associated peptidase YedK
MPVILGSQSEVDRWLQPELSVEEVLKLAKPYESPDLVWHPVTSEVGKPSFDSPACVKEVRRTQWYSILVAFLCSCRLF